jgi:hypothetical protein
MRVLNIAIFAILIITLGCVKDNTINTDCIEAMLNKRNMLAYNGEEIGCKMFLTLYHYDNKQYFHLGCHCADIFSLPIDCEGNEICINDDSECKRYVKRAERIGIVGIGD